LGVDWVALSFVQRPEDVAELRRHVGGRASVMTKLEKPAAIRHLDDIVAISDAVMVARGDLGVEMRPEEVPSVQKRIVRACRRAGKPVVVATQMLESMINAPTPTRAETTDVATAIYDGVDAVMLSGETAIGEYPVEAVSIMHRIIFETERDPYYRETIAVLLPQPDGVGGDAVCAPVGVLPPDPLGPGESAHAGRCHPGAGVPAGDRPAAAPRRGHHRDPGVHLLLERLPVR